MLGYLGCSQSDTELSPLEIAKSLNEKAGDLLMKDEYVATSRAIVLLDSAISLDSNYRWSYVNVSTAYCSNGRGDKALPYLEKLTRLEPKDPNHWLVQGIILENCGFKDMAREKFLVSKSIFDEAIRENPEKISLRLERALLSMILYSPGMGLDEYNQLQRLYPEDVNVKNMESIFRNFDREKYLKDICPCEK